MENYKKIEEAIEKTGYISEHKVSNLFSDSEWYTINNRYYFDNTIGTEREIDLIAYKVATINEIKLFTAIIISVKKNSENSWVFLTKDINNQDPNVKYKPIDSWTNSKIFHKMETSSFILNRILEKSKSNPIHKYLFDLERNIFAFQEVNLKNATPQNDKRIYDSIITLIRSLHYEKEALNSRKENICVYNFLLVSVMELNSFEYYLSKNQSTINETDYLKYTNRFIVNQKESNNTVHFVKLKELENFINYLNLLHIWLQNEYTEQFKLYEKKIKTNYDFLTLFLDEIEKELSDDIRHSLQLLCDFYIDKFRYFLFSYNKEDDLIIIDLGIEDENILEKMNSNKHIKEKVQTTLTKYYMTNLNFKFKYNEYGDIPF
ncbi:hypothetical protein [Leptospira vanthielii]|uniref:Uncharacterized protein n=1 Tax=Leptospira vanthielii serovar Holland str. Waz Holland = ATCC 700522 TaxID=1218591 RepID=N1VV15_9LEPT|nr:hypothetical protein [Leptospira vanthielii]EMY67779.1 hypothetical protein LEP1GSC199_0646 [Leptospira vanthielii serovar Holland str. Waz Holland = ATCC 700522]